MRPHDPPPCGLFSRPTTSSKVWLIEGHGDPRENSQVWQSEIVILPIDLQIVRVWHDFHRGNGLNGLSQSRDFSIKKPQSWLDLNSYNTFCESVCLFSDRFWSVLSSITLKFFVSDRWCFSLIPCGFSYIIRGSEIFPDEMIVEDLGIAETILIEYEQGLAIWIFMSVWLCKQHLPLVCLKMTSRSFEARSPQWKTGFDFIWVIAIVLPPQKSWILDTSMRRWRWV